MQQRILGIMLAVALLLGTGWMSPYALAQGGGEHGYGHAMSGGGRHGRGMMRMLRALDLTDEQKDKARQTLLAAHKQAIALRADLRVAQLELRDHLVQDEVDRAAINRQVARIGQLQQQLLQQRVETRLNLQAMLTPEQRAKARTLWLDHMLEGYHRPFHGRGRPHRER